MGRRWILLVTVASVMVAVPRTYAQDILPGTLKKSVSVEMVPNVESTLQKLLRVYKAQVQGMAELAVSLDVTFSQGKVTVIAEYEGEPPHQAVEAVGGRTLGCAEDFGLCEVEIPLDGLLELAAAPSIRFLRRPFKPTTLVTSEGADIIGATTWHSSGETGLGIRVAVLDLGFAGYSRALASGELGNVVFTRDYTGVGLEAGTEHGTACAEIVHDVAPGTELLLMKVSTEVDLANAVSDAITHGAHVITHSVGWFNTNFYDGTGIICDIVRTATSAGILWVNAAGNSADGDHWEGSWYDADGDGYLDFAPGDEVNTFFLNAGQAVSVWLTWNDWPRTAEDYDLYLVDATGSPVAQSDNVQNGTQPPTETLYFTAPASGYYGIVIAAHRVSTYPRLEVFCSPTSLVLEYSTDRSSIPAPGNAEEVFSVGAISWNNWTTGVLEPFSSRGPTNDGRIKPDICAPDKVSTLSYGPLGFPGTSASAPHVAGAAALVWGANPGRDAAWVRVFLERNAVDLGALGKDILYGYGKLVLPSPSGPPPGEGYSHTYPRGWNMASVPLAPDDPAPYAVFGDDLSPLFLWRWNSCDNKYKSPTEVSPTEGYWLMVPAGGATVDVQGREVDSDVMLLLPCPGWHQISTPWEYPLSEVRVANGAQEKNWAEAVSLGWIENVAWGYDPTIGYTLAAILNPWRGYWVKSNVPGLVLKFPYTKRR